MKMSANDDAQTHTHIHIYLCVCMWKQFIPHTYFYLGFVTVKFCQSVNTHRHKVKLNIKNKSLISSPFKMNIKAFCEWKKPDTNRGREAESERERSNSSSIVCTQRQMSTAYLIILNKLMEAGWRLL